MANTTFKGPVRSQNGFQELVDGVWTPVGGGGGGGGGVSLLVPFPTNGIANELVLPVPTAPGQITTVTSSWPTVGGIEGSINVFIQPSNPANYVAALGVVVVAGETPDGFMEQSSEAGDALSLGLYEAPVQMRITYLGPYKFMESYPAIDIYYVDMSIIPIG